MRILLGGPGSLFCEADDFFRRDGWHNTGGDRTWVAPEIDLSFPRFPDLSIYKVPGEIDPGKYELDRLGQCPRFVNRVKLRLFRSRQTTEVEIRKSWSAAVNPLGHERVWSQMAGVEYAGIRRKRH